MRRWESALLAYFDTADTSNGPPEATIGVIQTMRRILHGLRNSADYRLRALLVAKRYQPWRQAPAHAQI
ncbi:transposase [Kocuria sp. CH-021]|uniref:transposase n=1 Tax=Kocuria sp. CH-021 TaxID=3406735 RepID=UPI003C72BC1B